MLYIKVRYNNDIVVNIRKRSGNNFDVDLQICLHIYLDIQRMCVSVFVIQWIKKRLKKKFRNTFSKRRNMATLCLLNIKKYTIQKYGNAVSCCEAMNIEINLCPTARDYTGSIPHICPINKCFRKHHTHLWIQKYLWIHPSWLLLFTCFIHCSQYR